MEAIEHIIGTHMWPGKVRIDVEKVDDCNVKMNVDTGVVNFCDIPQEYKNSSDHFSGAELDGIPIIFIEYGNTWWINLTILDGEFRTGVGDDIEFPYTTSIDKCDKILKSFDFVITSLVKDDYIKAELMSYEEMKSLLNSGILPSEVSRYSWRLYKAYAIQNKNIKSYHGLVVKNCAMCHKYKFTCVTQCPLGKDNMGSCGAGTFSKSCNTKSNEDFINVCSEMIEKINEAVIKERGVKDMVSITQHETKYKFGEIEIIVNPTDRLGEFTLTIEGMKENYDLPEEYLDGYPRCFYDKSDDSFKLRCSDEHEMEEDGTHDSYYGDWLFTGSVEDGGNTFSAETVKEIVNEIEKCVERLRKINNKEEKVGIMEKLFDGLSEYVESVTYDFDGCVVKVTKTKYNDEFEIDINPGSFDFKRKSASDRKMYSFEHGSHGYDWRINERLANDMHNFDTCDTCSANDINKILTHIKKEVESINTTPVPSDISYPSATELPSTKVELMTAKEVQTLLDKGDALPAEISKEKWLRFKAYAIQNNYCSKRDMFTPDPDYETCALCVIHNGNCDKCSLVKVDYSCKDSISTYAKVVNYRNENKEEFIKLIDSMISALDKAIEYEEKNNLVIIPDGEKTFNFNGVNVITKQVGWSFETTIVDNDKKLNRGKNIEIQNEKVRCTIWPDLSCKQDWYINCTTLSKLSFKDAIKFVSHTGGTFDNGISLSREGTALLVTLIKKCAECEE